MHKIATTDLHGDISTMIKAFINDVAFQMGLKLSNILLIEDELDGCSDTQLIHMFSDGHMVSAIVYVTEFDDVMVGKGCETLELRIMSAMSRLKMMLEP